MTKHLLCDLRDRSASVNDLKVGDIDNDCDVDIVTSDDKKEIYAWQNLGGVNSWDPMANISVVGVLGYNATALAFADFDNDGWLDILAGTDNEGKVMTIENDQSCWSETWDMTLMGLGGEGRVLSVGVGDLDLDGDIDSITGHFDYSGGGGTALSWENILMHRNMAFVIDNSMNYGSLANDGVLVDLDNDGDLDGLVACNLNVTGGELLLIQNTQSGPPLIFSLEVGATMMSVAAADLDNDGDEEIIGGISGYLYMWYNIGDPWTGGWPMLTIESDATLGYAHIRTADFDLDGDIDIVVGGTGPSGDRVRVYQNDGNPLDGGWKMNVVTATFPGVVISLDVADFDNNGSMDIVAGGNSDAMNKLVVFENDKTPFSGYWTKYDIGTLGSGSYPQSIVAADFDNDCEADIAVGESHGSNRVYALMNDGTPYDGLWTSSIANTMLDDVWAISAADFDLDGDMDIAVGGDVGDTYQVRILVNEGSPFSMPWSTHDVGAPGSRVLAIVVGSLDKDADPEVLALCMNTRMYPYFNVGAQVMLEAIDVSPPSISADTSDDVLRIRVSPNGISSDDPAVVKKWCFHVYATDGVTPLTPTEMNETFRSFSLYRYNGDLVWNNVSDSLVHSNATLSGNAVVLNISGSDPDSAVAQLTSAYMFFVVDLQWGASIPGFRVYFDPDGWNGTLEANLLVIEDVEKCLSVQPATGVMTGAITVIVIPEFSSLLVPMVGMIAAVLAMRSLRGARKTS